MRRGRTWCSNSGARSANTNSGVGAMLLVSYRPRSKSGSTTTCACSTVQGQHSRGHGASQRRSLRPARRDGRWSGACGATGSCRTTTRSAAATAATRFPLHDRRPHVNAPNIAPELIASLSAAYGEAVAGGGRVRRHPVPLVGGELHAALRRGPRGRVPARAVSGSGRDLPRGGADRRRDTRGRDVRAGAGRARTDRPFVAPAHRAARTAGPSEYDAGRARALRRRLGSRERAAGGGLGVSPSAATGWCRGGWRAAAASPATWRWSTEFRDLCGARRRAR